MVKNQYLYLSEIEEMEELLEPNNDGWNRIIEMEEAYHFSNRTDRRRRRRRQRKENKKNSTRYVVKKGRIRPLLGNVTFYKEGEESMHTQQPSITQYTDAYDNYNDDDDDDDDDDDEIPSAESLGLENGPMYERLRSIIQGADITPEDYDLLLLLDSNNAKKTMDNQQISEISLVVLGNGTDEDPFRNWGSSTCDICLESFKELPKGTEVRHLPCNHVFCKKCIDHWFSEVSVKCPNLSCYWQKESTSDD